MLVDIVANFPSSCISITYKCKRKQTTILHWMPFGSFAFQSQVSISSLCFSLFSVLILGRINVAHHQLSSVLPSCIPVDCDLGLYENYIMQVSLTNVTIPNTNFSSPRQLRQTN